MAGVRSTRVRSVAMLFLILASMIITLQSVPYVKASMTISYLYPTSGVVGSSVDLTANISSANGAYKLYFDDNQWSTGNAMGYDVNVSLTIPDAVAGDHNVMVLDVATGENTTRIFNVQTSYTLNATVPESPKQLQEGDTIPIYVAVAGSNSNQTYVANVTITDPDEVSYTKLLEYTTSTVGNATVTVNYPGVESEWSPSNASTRFVGEYRVFFNTSYATGAFYVGLTNSTEYHRNDVVDIRAAGYASNESVTLTITGNDLNYTANLTANSAGIVDYSGWNVPPSASIGSYRANMTSTLNITSKEPPDLQTFSIPGFDVNITAKNLASDPVSDVIVRTFEGGASIVNATSDTEGQVHLKLETGGYTCNAALALAPNQEIGESRIEVGGAAAFDLICNLTNMKILIVSSKDEREIYIPGVELDIFSPKKNQTLVTDINGTVTAKSLLPNYTYVLNASRYGTVFETTSIPSLLVNQNPIAWFYINLTCPTVTLSVNLSNPNAQGQPINGAVVKVQELQGGLYYENVTTDGVASFNCILGNYSVRIYDSNGLMLNETGIFLNKTKSILFSCSLYGLDILVRVVDYFGQPIPNANVTLTWENQQGSWVLTRSDGTAEFIDVTGGDAIISVYLPGASQPCIITTCQLENSTTIRADKYVLIAGSIIEISPLITVVAILVIILLVLSVEIYRRRRSKPATAEA